MHDISHLFAGPNPTLWSILLIGLSGLSLIAAIGLARSRPTNAPEVTTVPVTAPETRPTSRQRLGQDTVNLAVRRFESELRGIAASYRTGALHRVQPRS